MVPDCLRHRIGIGLGWRWRYDDRVGPGAAAIGNMTPAEILSAGRKERMCAVVTPDNVEAFMAVCGKWDVLATVIGEVAEGDG